MNGWMSPAAADRHVVFPDLARGRRRPLDPAPVARTGGTAAPPRPPPPAEPALDAGDESFLDWLFDRAGLAAWRHYRPGTLKRRLPACLRVARAPSPALARPRLEDRPELIPAAVSALVIGVTAFFRDPPVFDRLRDEVLPRLARDRGRLRVWSAACSGGAELYAVAMLLDRLQLLARSDLLGTDCRADAVGDAAAGRFSPDAVNGLSPDLLGRYFETGAGPAGDALNVTHDSGAPTRPAGQPTLDGTDIPVLGGIGIRACAVRPSGGIPAPRGRTGVRGAPLAPGLSGQECPLSTDRNVYATEDWADRNVRPAQTRMSMPPVPETGRCGSVRVRRWLRGAVRWRRADVVRAAEPGPWDLVLCRNLAIYLQPAAADRLWANLAGVLRPGGVLAVGKAERPGRDHGFRQIGPCLYQRSGPA